MPHVMSAVYRILFSIKSIPQDTHTYAADYVVPTPHSNSHACFLSRSKLHGR